MEPSIVAEQLGLRLIERLPGGEHGAYLVERDDGVRRVLKVFPSKDGPTVVRAVELARRVRATGVPVPDAYDAGYVGEAAYTLQELRAGVVPRRLTPSLAASYLDCWEHQLDLVPEGGTWNDETLAVLSPGSTVAWPSHTLLRAYGGDPAEILDECIRIGGSVRCATMRAHDVIHGDRHHVNLLTADGQLDAIIDWENAAAGDARFDLVVLRYWCDVFEETEVDPIAAALVRERAANWVDAEADAWLSARHAVNMLAFVTERHPDRVPSRVADIRRFLRPRWRPVC